MNTLALALGALSVVAGLAGASTNAWAEPETTTLRYAVMREGQQIGTTTVQLRRNGTTTTAEIKTAEIKTNVQVKIAYITVYRFEQTEVEHWNNGKLEALNAVTNDNGTMHRVTARNEGGVLTVDADGKTSRVDPSLIPVSLWNAGLIKRSMALNPQDGSVTPVSVVDHGKEDVVLQGKPVPARHYSIATSFSQDVWYDDKLQLIRVELRGSDGSKIHYQPS